MSTPAFELSEPADGSGRSAEAGQPKVMTFLLYLDLVALAFAGAVCLVAGFSMLGYAVGAGVWIGQRIVRDLIAKRAEAATDVRTSVGLTAASMIMRGWITAFAIFAVGLNNPEAGLVSAVLILFLFSIFFTMQAILRPQGRATPPRPAP